jgi:hypothetical protein
MSWVAIAVGTGIGAASGGIMSAINKQPIWKGMLIGAGTGAAGGALGAGLGALGGAASGSTSGAVATTGTEALKQTGVEALKQTGTEAVKQTGAQAAISPTVQTAVNPTVQAALTQSPTAITSQGIGTAANAPTIGIGGAAPAASAPATSSAQSGLTSMIDKAMPALKGAMPGAVLDMAKGTMSGTTFTGDAGEEQQAKEAQGAEWAQDTYSSGSWLPGKAKGGAIHLRDGDFIIPADVVSAIGNGSTKAGAKYLDHLFTALSAGPAPKAGSLAKQRAKARRAA